MRLVYEGGSEMRLVREIAPAPASISCEFIGEESHENSEFHVGCRTLKFEYQSFPIPGHILGATEKLGGISYYGPSGSGVGSKVAEYKYKLGQTTEWPFIGGAVIYHQEEMLSVCWASYLLVVGWGRSHNGYRLGIRRQRAQTSDCL
jgi:hypothetical protein